MMQHDPIDPQRLRVPAPADHDGSGAGSASTRASGVRGRVADMRHGTAHAASIARGLPLRQPISVRMAGGIRKEDGDARLSPVPGGITKGDTAALPDVAASRMNRVCRRAIDARLRRMNLDEASGRAAHSLRQSA
ncbi:hypothetical protein [Sphingomonas sp. CFBP 8760]|uniref:hypothetical protein n=1 Tax=Sphingomonas sp. CFBP 8760 TaxID=2775282 RepID=UPI001A9197CD|nr:hypothetical protein [Sphingomonas sp. CFBP 8760]